MRGYIFSSEEFHQLMFFLRKSFGICDSEADNIKNQRLMKIQRGSSRGVLPCIFDVCSVALIYVSFQS
jgi:hypothetical protein